MGVKKSGGDLRAEVLGEGGPVVENGVWWGPGEKVLPRLPEDHYGWGLVASGRKKRGGKKEDRDPEGEKVGADSSTQLPAVRGWRSWKEPAKPISEKTRRGASREQPVLEKSSVGLKTPN